jgi:hypothetical protein
LGIAPPGPPRSGEERKDTNELSELLRGNTRSTNKIGHSSSFGAVRRGVGSAIPTQNLDNAFMPPPEPTAQLPDESSTPTKHLPDVNQHDLIDREHPHAIDAIYGRNDLDERILAAARALSHARLERSSPGKYASSLSSLLKQFEKHQDRTLSIELPNESAPKQARRVPLTSATSDENELRQNLEDGVLLIAYVTGLQSGRGKERISVCSGFAVEGGDRLSSTDGQGKGALIVTCAHTLRGSVAKRDGIAEEESSIALAITRSGHVFPVASLLSSLPSNDLLLLQLGEEAITVDENSTLGTPLRSSNVQVRTLPISAYPAPVGSELCVSSFWGWEDDAGSTLPAFEFQQQTQSGPEVNHMSAGAALTISAAPIPPPMGREAEIVKRERDDAGRSRWGRARLVQYRDASGAEALSGTYDDLTQLDFKLLPDNVHNPPALLSKPQASFPPPGSSGGPIVDAQTGAVVGITRGTKMSVLEGKRGDGIPAERVFFMFALPGFSSKKEY